MRQRLCELEMEMDGKGGREGKGKARWHKEASAKGKKEHILATDSPDSNANWAEVRCRAVIYTCVCKGLASSTSRSYKNAEVCDVALIFSASNAK